MFGKSVKADWKVKGFKYKIKNGVLKGKIYTAWPMRIGVAIGKTILANIVIFLGMLAFMESPLADIQDLNMLTYLLWLCVLVLSLPYYLFFEGKRIKVTNTHCTIGRKRYRLADMTSFTAKEVSFKTPNQFFIEFSYGKKRKKIKVRNNFDNQLDVIQSLNRLVQQVMNPGAPASDGLTARSASF